MASNNMASNQRFPSAAHVKLARQHEMPFLPPPGMEHAMPEFIELGSMLSDMDMSKKLDSSKTHKKYLNQFAGKMSTSDSRTYRMQPKRTAYELQVVIYDSLRQLFSDLNVFKRLNIDGIKPLKGPLLPTNSREEFHGYSKGFKTDAFIGKGAFGSVFKVLNLRDNQEYALKQTDFRHELIDAEELTFKEVRLYSRLTHSNIVGYKSTWTDIVGYVDTGFDDRPSDEALTYCFLVSPTKSTTDIQLFFGHDADKYQERREYELISRLYIQMELCDISLEYHIKERNHKWPLTNKEKLDDELLLNELDIFRQVLKGVEFLHANEIIHRDLKPSNILLGKDKRWKIADFGLSVYHGDLMIGQKDQDELGQGDMYHTSKIGTAAYRAPECKDNDYDSKADMYSLGVILVDLLYPLSSGDKVELTNQLLDLLDCNWLHIASLVRSLLSHDPDERPAAGQVLSSELFSRHRKCSGTGQTQTEPHMVNLQEGMETMGFGSR